MSCTDASTYASAAKHPLSSAPNAPKKYTYGTSGFRMDAGLMDGIVYRMGILAALRARKLKQAVGVCLTASHNQYKDNGVKLIDANGEMLEGAWEGYATQLANSATAEDIAKSVGEILAAESIPLSAEGAGGVVVARDTRASGVALTESTLQGAIDLGQQGLDFGLMTTPQAHWAVMAGNKGAFQLDSPEAPGAARQHYMANMLGRFKELAETSGKSNNLGLHLRIDAAGGVGSQVLDPLREGLSGLGVGVEGLNLAANIQPEQLNDKCGADFVQKELAPPLGIEPAPTPEGTHIISFDGDADRVVYINFDPEGKFELLDGDRMLALFCRFFQQQFEILGLPLEGEGAEVSLGAVQTAYANGGSTKFLKEVAKVPVAFTKTGVKHLHHKAKDFDIGAYFEANGHGTVTFTQKFTEYLAKLAAEVKGDSAKETAVRRLQLASELLHPTVGDALSDALMVEACLLTLNLTIRGWASMYPDLPSRQLKASVPDPQRVKTIPDESRATAPEGLQDRIDAAVAPVEQGRAFVRPSGTEPIVRVYAEATTREAADQLANSVVGIVKDVLQ